MAAALTDEQAQQARITAQRELFQDTITQLRKRGKTIDMDPLRLEALSMAVGQFIADGTITEADLNERVLGYMVRRCQQELKALTTGRR